MTRLVGHIKQREQFSKLISKEELSSCLMFSGISGIGKSLVAKEVFTNILCTQNIGDKILKNCGDCKNCKLLEANNHPDFYLIDCKDKEKWKLENIRSFLYSLNLKSFSGGARCIILNDADYLTIQAANCLLKILEEPRENTYFCLICSNQSKLPMTVLSRCQIWSFDKLNQEEILEVLNQKEDINKDEIQELFHLSDGSISNIESLIEDKESWMEISKNLDQIFKGDLNLAISLSENLAKNKDTLAPKLVQIRNLLRNNMHKYSGREQSIWAHALSNLLSADYYIFDRNISAKYYLSQCFIKLISNRNVINNAGLKVDNNLIEDFII